MITWGEVKERFEGTRIQLMRERDGLRELWSTHFLSRGDKADSPLCLYFIFVRDLGAIELDDGISLVVIGVPDEEAVSLLESVDNCLCADECYETFASYSSIMGVLRDQYYIGYLMYQIHDHIYHNRGIQAVVDEVADFFRLPVSVMDTAFRFIARSQHFVERSDDPEVRLSPESDALTDEVLTVLEQYGVLDEVMASNAPIHVRIRDSAWFVPIFVNHTKAAYLTFYEQATADGDSLSDQYVYALPLIAGALSIEISKDSFYLYNKASYFTYIFSLMLERERVETEDIRSRLRIFGYDLRPQLYVLCLDLPYGAASGLTHTTLADTLKDTFRNSIYVTRDHELVFLVSRREEDLVKDGEIARWQRILRSSGVSAGLSGPFEGVDAVRRHLTLARQALSVGKRRLAVRGDDRERLFRFEDVQVDALLSNFEAYELVDYCYGPLVDLCSYDDEHHTDLVETLRVYLHNPRDINGICNQLCIHKNTLYKRLDRIRTVMGTDFVSAETIMRIQLTMHMRGIA